MLQANHMPGSRKNLTFTPMLRVFKGDYLAEFGLNNYKDFMFNFIKRFQRRRNEKNYYLYVYFTVCIV